MRSLLSVSDIEDEVTKILDIASDFKAGKIEEKPLKDQKLAMIFEKSSTRTRVSFEVGMYELGGTALFLSSNDLQLGRGEPIKDTAKVLSRFVDAIMIRAIKHDDVVELRDEASIPIINGLTNLEHPCQALADMLTVKEHKGGFDGKFVYDLPERQIVIQDDLPYLEYFANGGSVIEFMKKVDVWGEDLTEYNGFSEKVIEIIKSL